MMVEAEVPLNLICSQDGAFGCPVLKSGKCKWRSRLDPAETKKYKVSVETVTHLSGQDLKMRALKIAFTDLVNSGETIIGQCKNLDDLATVGTKSSTPATIYYSDRAVALDDIVLKDQPARSSEIVN